MRNISNYIYLLKVSHKKIPRSLLRGVSFGGIILFGGGLPFHKDTETKYKCYNLDYQTNCYATMNNEYKTNYWFESPSDSKLTVYTPWEQQDGQYIRFKREYELINLINLDLYNAILTDDYDVSDVPMGFPAMSDKDVALSRNTDNKYTVFPFPLDAAALSFKSAKPCFIVLITCFALSCSLITVPMVSIAV